MLNLGSGTNLGSAYGEVKIGTEDAQRSLKTLADAVDGMNRMTFTIGDAIRNSIDLGVKAAVTSLAVVTGALVATGAKGLASFASLEKGMNEVFTLLPGMSEEAMNAMTDDLQGLNKEFGLLSDESVPALYQAISAGVPADNVFDFLETAQKAAVGGVTELQTAVDGISSVVNAYGDDVVGATKASDLMFTAVKLGKTDFEQLSGSLFNVIPTAAALGVNFEDVTAALASMTAQGTPTSVATTQLRQLFVELSKEGTATSDIFKEIAGVSFRDFIAAGGNTQDALILLEKYAKDSNIGINDLFGSVEAGGAALALTGKGTESFTRNLAEMDNAAGATEKAYDQMDQGISRSISKIRAALSTMMEQVGEKLEPMFSKLVEWVQKNMPKFSEIVVGVFGEIAKFAEENLPGALDTLQGGFDSLSKNIVPFTRDVLGKLQDAFNYVRDDLIPMAREVLPEIMKAFSNFADELLPFIKEHFPKFVEGLRDMWDASKPLRDMIGNVVDKFGDLDAKQIELIAKAGLVVLAIGPVVSAISGLVSIFTGAMGLVSAIGTVIGWLTGGSGITVALSTVAAALGPAGILAIALAGLAAAWAGDFGGIRTATVEALGRASQAFSEWANDARDAISQMKESIVPAVSDMVQRVTGFFGELWRNATSVFDVGKWLRMGADLVGGLIRGIQDSIGNAVRAITGFGGALLDRFREMFGIRSPSTVFAEIGEYMMQGLEGGLRSASTNVSSFMDSFTSRLVSTARGSVRQFEDLLTTAYNAAGGNKPVTQGASALDLTGALSEQAALIKQRIREVQSNLSPKEKVQYGQLLLEGAQKLASAAIQDGSKTVLDQASNAIRSIIESGIASELKFTMEDGMPSSVAFTNRLWELFRQIQIGGGGAGGNYIGQDAANALGGNVVGGNSNFLGAAMEALLGGYGRNLTAMIDSMSGGAISGNRQATPQVINNYNFQLDYQTQQSLGSVGQDVTLLNALYGGS